MKKTKLILLLPALLLASCGENYGKAITVEEASPKINQITSKTLDTSTMNLVAKEDTVAYDATKKQKVTMKTDIIVARGKIKKFTSKISSGGSSATTEATWFQDSRYGGEVYYLSVSDGKTTQKMKVAKSSTQFATINKSCEELNTQLKDVIKNMQEPLATLSRKDIVKGSISGFEFTYFAKGEDDLTIKSKPNRGDVTGYFNATYNKGLIKKYDYKFTNKEGTYLQEKYDLDFNGDVNVKVPSGFDNVITAI